MKNSLLEMLMNFFGQSLSQLANNNVPHTSTTNNLDDSDDNAEQSSRLFVINHANQHSIRVFTSDEQTKFTKASYQFIMRMLLWRIISPDSMELVLNQLLFSDSRYITLEETKWAIRDVLAEHLDARGLIFLDLVLYQKEDNLPLH